MKSMKILVDIKKRLWSGRRVFRLEVAFASDKDFVVLFGPSGAGKSLTLQAIAGLITPDEGRIVVGERILFDSAPEYQGAGPPPERGLRLPGLRPVSPPDGGPECFFRPETRLALVPAPGRTAAPGGGAGDF